MSNAYIIGSTLMLIGTFIAAVSQIMLKKAAQRKYSCRIAEYINPLVVGGYVLLLSTTLISVLALHFIPMSFAAAFDNTGQIFVPLLSFFVLREHINRQKILGMLIIMVGLIVYFF